MNWYQELYLSKNLTGKEKSVKWMVEHKVEVRPLFLIVLSNRSDAQLEIVSLATLKFPFFRKEKYNIIGVAKGYYHARTLVETIAKDVYEATGQCDFKAYFATYFEEDKGE